MQLNQVKHSHHFSVVMKRSTRIGHTQMKATQNDTGNRRKVLLFILNCATKTNYDENKVQIP